VNFPGFGASTYALDRIDDAVIEAARFLRSDGAGTIARHRRPVTVRRDPGHHRAQTGHRSQRRTRGAARQRCAGPPVAKDVDEFLNAYAPPA
jgi:hypothetical protein